MTSAKSTSMNHRTGKFSSQLKLIVKFSIFCYITSFITLLFFLNVTICEDNCSVLNTIISVISMLRFVKIGIVFVFYAIKKKFVQCLQTFVK